MPNYRRAFVPGGTFFFTVVTHRRRRIFHDQRFRELLSEAMHDCRRDWPFEVNAIVLLPDHLHAIWTLPRGDQNYSARWSVIKKGFTTKFIADGGADWQVSSGKQREQRRGVWQRRYWEHTIENEDDFEAHFDYIHFNPVKHGLVKCPRDWAASSFHRWVEQGVYPNDWACESQPRPSFPKVKHNYGEPI